MLGLELSVVSVILRCQPSVGALQHLGPTISRFLGPSPHLPFHYASTFGSIALLDWIWSCSCTSVATRPPEWSLANFLRSDPHYHRWEFSISVEWAASRGDLEIIKWLLTHFSDCKVPVEAVEEAVSNGQLAVLQYLLDRDTNNQDNAGPNNKKRKVTESGELVSVGDSPASAKAKQIVCWDRNEEYNTGLVKIAIDNGHIDVARWLYDNIATERNEDYVRAAIQAALNRNDLELAKSFVPPGRDVMGYVGYSVFCTRNVQVVEHMIDSGSLQRMSYIGAVAIKDLVASGRLDLMQRVASLRYSPRRNNREWVDVWRGVLKSVCFRGDCAMVQWATEHPMGRQACKLLKRDEELSQLLWRAVAGGNSVEVLQCLKDSGSVDKYGSALVEAVAKNDMKSIEWLLDNFPQSEHLSDYCVLNEAAKWGHLHLLEHFQSLPSVPGFVPGSSQIQEDERGEASRTNAAFGDSYRDIQGDRQWQRFRWHSTDAMDNAVANGHLETVQWLHANRTEGCTTRAMDLAAARGNLDVVKWLQANRSEGLTTNAMDRAAFSGHLHVVEWLHEHTSAGCTSEAMDWAAENGYFSVVKWLHANRTEGCTSKAVMKSLQTRRLAVTSWLKRTFPQLKPHYVDLSYFKRIFFPSVLFMQEHYADLLSREIFGEDRFRFGASSESFIIDWMQENGL